MMREAESHAEDDRKRREEIEARNRADQAIYAAEQLVRENGDKMPASDKSAIESAIEDVRKALQGSDAAALTRAMDALTSAQHKAAEAMYRQAGAQGAGPEPAAQPGPGPSAGAGAGAQDEGVIDAEVVDEDRK
jgi:molecular chaperone DnaK